MPNPVVHSGRRVWVQHVASPYSCDALHASECIMPSSCILSMHVHAGFAKHLEAKALTTHSRVHASHVCMPACAGLMLHFREPFSMCIRVHCLGHAHYGHRHACRACPWHMQGVYPRMSTHAHRYAIVLHLRWPLHGTSRIVADASSTTQVLARHASASEQAACWHMYALCFVLLNALLAFEAGFRCKLGHRHDKTLRTCASCTPWSARERQLLSFAAGTLGRALKCP